MAIVASKDGTRGYDIASTPNRLIRMDTELVNNGANLVAVGKLQYLNNVHLADRRVDYWQVTWRALTHQMTTVSATRPSHLLLRSIGRWDPR